MSGILLLAYLALALFAFAISIKISQFIQEENRFPSMGEYLSYKPTEYRLVRYLSVLAGAVFAFGAIVLFPKVQTVSAWDDVKKFAPFFIYLIGLIAITYIALKAKAKATKINQPLSTKIKNTIVAATLIIAILVINIIYQGKT